METINEIPFLNIMKFVANKYSIEISDNFNIFFIKNMEPTIRKFPTHIRIFKFYIYSNALLKNKEYLDIIIIYLKSMSIWNAFKKFLYRKKIKNAINSNINIDFYFNNLDKFKKNHKISLLCQNTIYNFRISDIINLWYNCLIHSENLFCKPKRLKNPYTNMEFENHNLYNLSIAIHNTGFYVPQYISWFFYSGFNIDDFVYKYYPFLKDIAIQDFVKNGMTTELYEKILELCFEYKEELNYKTLPERLTYARKRYFVRQFRLIIKYYLYSCYCCNPLMKCEYTRKAKRYLLEWFEDNKDSPFIISITPPPPIYSPPPTPPLTSINVDDEVSNIINSTNIFIEETINTIIQENTIDISNNNINLLNPFMSRNSLPRTPPNNLQRTTPNNIQSFGMNLGIRR
tara:strand:- start:7608 stop:8810 length:1203 start_codon:yes stop_codon:yes gene_type:complete